MQSFSEFNISPEVLATLEKMGFTKPTEIQEKTIPVLLNEKPQDLVALASTGTGKTAAFGIPLIEKIDAKAHFPQALVLSPTRELASQVADQLKKIGAAKGIQVAIIYGGSSYRTQIQAIKKGAQIVVATPGRLVDLLEQDLLNLTKVKMLILDEADEMLSMGFQESLNFILSATHPEEVDDNTVRASCQTWLFSATMSANIRHLTKRYLEKPFFIEVSTGKGLSPTIRHTYFSVRHDARFEGLLRLIRSLPQFYGFIFCQTKLEVADLEQMLIKNNFPVESLHGDKNQKDREYILKRFRAGETRIVVATDVAARGLDIQNLTHVINLSLPWNIETYIHRVGRTGRNGSEGHAFTLVGPQEIRSLVRLQKQTGIEFTKGVFPKPIDHAVSEIKKVFDLMDQEFQGSRFRLADQAVSEGLKGREHWEGLNQDHLISKLFLLMKPELFNQSEKNIDFLDGRPPREFQEGGSRKSSEGRSRGEYRPRGEGRSRSGGGSSSRFGGDKREKRGGRDRDQQGSSSEGRYKESSMSERKGKSAGPHRDKKSRGTSVKKRF